MKFILLSLTLAIIALLCGCANLMQPRDPNVVTAQATAGSAEQWVKIFQRFVAANPQLGLGEKGAAENLDRSFDNDLKNLYGTLALYKTSPQANQQALRDAIALVAQHEQVAKYHLNGKDIRGQGAPYAPSITFPSIASPGQQPTVLDNIYDRLGGIQAEQTSQRAVLTMIQTNLGKQGHAIWSITNQLAGATNIVPKAPAIPGK